MILSRIIAAAACGCLGATVLPAVAAAGSLGSVQGLPFFAHPYPYGYVYQRPPVECYDIRPVDTLFGQRLELVWVCGAPVTARY